MGGEAAAPVPEAVAALLEADDWQTWAALYQAWPELAGPDALAALAVLLRDAKGSRDHRRASAHQQRLEFLTRARVGSAADAAQEQRSRDEFALHLAARAYYATTRTDVEHLILIAFPNLRRLDIGRLDGAALRTVRRKRTLIERCAVEAVDRVLPLVDAKSAAVPHDERWRYAAALAWDMGAGKRTTQERGVERAGAFALCAAARLLAPSDLNRTESVGLLRLQLQTVAEEANSAADSGNLADRLGALDWMVLLSEPLLREDLSDDDRDGVRRGLVAALVSRYSLTGHFPALAVETAREVSPDMTALANTLTWRFERSRRIADIDAAIELYERVAAAAPDDDAFRPHSFSNLGNALRERFDLTRLAEDIDRAITVSRSAVALMPSSDPLRAGMLSNLCKALRARFIRSGGVADIDEAITAGRAAVQAASPDDRDRAAYLSNLAEAHTVRVGSVSSDEQRAEVAEALREGMRRAEQAGDVRRQAELSLTYARWLSRPAGIDADIESAIELYDEALALAPEDHPRRAAYLANRAMVLQMRAVRSGQTADAGQAVADYTAALDGMSAQDPRRTGMLNNLVGMLGEGSLHYRVKYLREAATVEAAPPHQRLRVARAWAEAAVEIDDPSDAVEAYRIAIGMLVRLAWGGRDRTHQEDQISTRPGLAGDAAAVAVRAGQPERAVELLEQGRSVLWAQQLQLRGDLARLREREPNLARDLESVRAVLNQPLAVPEPAADQGPAPSGPRDEAALTAGQRLRAVERWEDLLGRARSLPGFEDFLLPMPFERLASVLDGPVVMVNTSVYGSHALIVSTEDGVARVRVERLPGLKAEEAREKAEAFMANVRRSTAADAGDSAVTAAAAEPRSWLDRERDRHELLDILEWLWSSVAEPVLDALGCSGPPPEGGHPRVWWCPTGPLTVLPLHAAGLHTRSATRPTNPADTVSGRVVSSYAPSLTLLGHLRRPRTAADRGTPVRRLALGVSQGPGQSPLPAVHDELAALTSHFAPPSVVTQLVDQQATRANLLAAIGQHRWIHLACHARQRRDEPVASAFSLWDGELTLAELAVLHTSGGDFAFLSACQTATGSAELVDEAIHLAGALLVLGYRQVVATMWTVDDGLAPELCDAVYRTIASADPANPPAALALHRAVETLRAAHPADPLVWAPYIHTGG